MNCKLRLHELPPDETPGGIVVCQRITSSGASRHLPLKVKTWYEFTESRSGGNSGDYRTAKRRESEGARRFALSLFRNEVLCPAFLQESGKNLPHRSRDVEDVVPYRAHAYY
ncbi:MAG: hypothetical protein IK090_08940 [Clostridia bacterium]|nr:hypothetical protein [Clostridia bacterium]